LELNDAVTTRSLVVSIRPHFAAAAYGRNKLFEYRRVRMNARSGDRVLVYESWPISKVTGEFRVGRVIVASTADLVQLERDPQLRTLVQRYLQGARVGTALEICNPKRWGMAVPVDRFIGKGKSAPVSYAFLVD
jgi:predicted transcriptional regulator